MSMRFDLIAEFERRHLSSKDFLQLPQVELEAEMAETYLVGQAQSGYLLVSLAEDEVLHGDAQFRQRRGPARPPMPTKEFWQLNLRFHNWLCEQGQVHLPIRLGSGPTAAAALVWLIPAPTTGKIIATGFSQDCQLDEKMQKSWLLAWAHRISEQYHPIRRLLVQLPNLGLAYWYYRTYLGDLAMEGSPSTQLRTLLQGLPRYAASESEELLAPCHETGNAWPLLVNEPADTYGKEEERSDNHCELMALLGRRY